MKYIFLSICLLMSLSACKTTEHTQADPVNLTQYLLKSRGLLMMSLTMKSMMETLRKA